MEIVEIGNLREAHKQTFVPPAFNGLVKVECDDENLPKRGIIIRGTKAELARLGNLLYKRVRIVASTPRKPRKGDKAK